MVFLLATSRVTSANGLNPPPHSSKIGLKLICNVNIVCRNLKIILRNVHEFGFRGESRDRGVMTWPAMHDFSDDGRLCTYTRNQELKLSEAGTGTAGGMDRPSQYKSCLLSHCPAASVSDPDSMIPDPDPAFWAEYRSGSRVWNFFYIKNCNLLIPMPP